MRLFFHLVPRESKTTHLNPIMTAGAADLIADQAFLEREIRDWKQSFQRRMQLCGERYYAGEQKILQKKRLVIGPDGDLSEVKNLPNNRIVDNQYGKIVDQKVNYLLGKPITFDTPNERYGAALKDIFNNRFYRMFRCLGEDALNGGIGWLLVNYDDGGQLYFKRLESYEILPFWADSEHTNLDAAVHLYEVEEYQGKTKAIVEHVEVFTVNGVFRYTLNNEALSPEQDFYSPYIVSVEQPLNWSKIPLIPFKCNNKELPLICRVKSLQDAINQILSTFEDNMEEDPRNTIFVVINYGGQEPGEFRRNLSTYGLVKVENKPDRPGGDVKTLSVEVNCENYKAILEVLKKALIENARGYDAKDDRLSGNANQMNIMSMYSDIDLDANGMESEFQSSFEELLWFVNAHLSNIGAGDFAHEQVRVVFNRDILMNTTEQIEQCRNSEGQVSQRTILAHHPFVTDVEKELDQLAQEQPDPYEAAFPPEDEK